MRIDAEHGEMTFLVGEKKVKFDLHQSIPLADEVKRMCMRIESLLSPIEEYAPTFIQEETLEGFGIVANSLFTKELAFELISPIMEVEESILSHDEDDEGALAMIDDKTPRSSQNPPKSLAKL